MYSRTLATSIAVAALLVSTSWPVSGTRAEGQPVPGQQAEPRDNPEPEPRRAVPRSEPSRQPPPDSQRRAVPRTEAQPPRDQARPRDAERREPPRRVVPPRRYSTPPRAYYFPPVDVRVGFYYHPYFGFYYGPYYGPFYPFPGPFVRPSRYSSSAIRIQVRPVEAEVYLNGYYAGIVDDFDGIFQRLYVPAGEHHLELRFAGYASFRQSLYVGPGDTFEIRHQMQPLKPGDAISPAPAPRVLPPEWAEPASTGSGDELASPYGILAIRIEPTDAHIVIDGEGWAPVEGQEEFVIHLEAGWHQLEISKDGYQGFSTKLELQEGQTTRLNVALAR